MGLLDYFSLPNIILTRYEANKKTGFVGIDENGTVNLLNALKQKITYVDITPQDDGFGFLTQAYTIDGYNGNKYDLIVYAGLTTYIDFVNFAEGQSIDCVVNNANPGTVCLLVFSASRIIKWLNNALPEVKTNAIVTFYRSNGIIYAEIKKPYVGTSGSGSGASDDDSGVINLSAGTHEIVDGGIYYIYATTGIVTAVMRIGSLINEQVIFKIKDDTFDFVIDSSVAAELDGDVLPVTTELVNDESISITSDGTNLNIIH